MRKFLVLLATLALAGAASASSPTPIERLGKMIFFDNISADPRGMSCSSCHKPEMGWVGGIAGVNIHGSVYRGAEPQRFGNRKPPSSGYATFSPNFGFDADKDAFVGGNLWDGRATGEAFGSPTADQALGPFNAAAEQNIDLRAVCNHIARSKYAVLFEEVWGPGSLDCSEAGYLATAEKIARSIAAYEASDEVNPFSSKFDAYWQACLEAGNDPDACGLAEGEKAVLDPLHILTEQEFDGLIEFGEYCSPCHVSNAPGPGGKGPLFTTHEFDNLGVPKNPENPFYDMDDVILPGGDPLNPDGRDFVDLGLGGFLRTRAEWAHRAEENDGKMKIPTLRNVDLRRGNVAKAYMHNGFFKSLKDVVHFYNTRDIAAENWPAPEVDRNVNRELLVGKPMGNLELNEEAENALVAFMGTLSDGWSPTVRGGGKPARTVVLTDSKFDLGTVAPNPAHGTFNVSFTLPAAAPVALTVYDVTGRKVATRDLGTLGAGQHSILMANARLAPGVYMVCLDRAGTRFITRSIVIR